MDPVLSKRHLVRRMENAIGNLLSGSDRQTTITLTCPVCKRRRRVRHTYFWKFPRPKKKAAFLVRQMAGFLRTLPDFLIIGAAKSGTSSLYGLITAHPDVLPARVKEIKYFSFQSNRRRGILWYRSHFPSILYKLYLSRRHGRKVLSGEASAAYMPHQTAPAKTVATLPDVRLIAILRNPVDRAYSHYNMRIRDGIESLTFEDAIAREEDRIRYGGEKCLESRDLRGRPGWHSYLGGSMWLEEVKDFIGKDGIRRWYSYLGEGRYAEHLTRWLEHFDRDRLLVMTLEDLEADRQGMMNRVWEFLGLVPFDVDDLPPPDQAWAKRFASGPSISTDPYRFNVGRYPPMNPDTRRMLVDYFRPHNERLSRLLRRDFDWDR